MSLFAKLRGRTRNSRPFPEPEGKEKTNFRLRLIIAIPALTTLLVLGLGLAVIKLAEFSSEEMLQLGARKSLEQGRLPEESINVAKYFMTRLLDQMVSAVIIGSVIAFFSGIILAISITSPIKRFIQGVSRIARGDLTQPLQLPGEGELAMLNLAYNEMLNSVNRVLLRSMAGGMVILDGRGKILSLSADAEAILNASKEEMAGEPLESLFPKNGQNIRLHEIVNRAILEKQTCEPVEIEMSRHDEERVRCAVSTSLLSDGGEALVGLIINIKDTHSLRKLQEQMQRIDRLTTLGGLAAGVAHQVRNPLCSIRGLAQLLNERSEGQGDPAMAQYANVILSDVERIDRVVERLLRFLQPTSSGWRMESVNEILADSIMLSRHEIRDKKIEIHEDFDPETPKVLAQSENLVQAVLNLIINAIQAIEDSGTIELITRHKKPAPGGGDGLVTMEIRDNGQGIPDADIGRIFDPSFTTKVGGSGFGLVIVRQTIEAHGGKIQVRSREGGPTAFHITLPVRTAPMEEKRKTYERGGATA